MLLQGEKTDLFKREVKMLHNIVLTKNIVVWNVFSKLLLWKPYVFKMLVRWKKQDSITQDTV